MLLVLKLTPQVYFPEILILAGSGNYPSFHTKTKVIQQKDVMNMYGKCSKDRYSLKKNCNTFKTIKQSCIWYLALNFLANFFQGTKKFVRFREISH